METEKQYLIYATNGFYKVYNTLEKATEEAYNYSHAKTGMCGVIELPETKKDAEGKLHYNLCMQSEKLAENKNTFIFLTPFSTKETHKESDPISVARSIVSFAPKIFNV